MLKTSQFWLKIWGLSYIVGVALFSNSAANPRSPNTHQTQYLQQLIHQALQEELDKSRYWHLLMHYRENVFDGYTSEADGPGFFLSPEGRINPKAELIATITRFFSEASVGLKKQTAQCAFPARFHWLNNKLKFDRNQLPEQQCVDFDRWFNELSPHSITLIFPSSYMNNPSSMFGHTFIRVDQAEQTEQTRLLAYSINYAAFVTTTDALSYMYNGVTGGFKGYFSDGAYYEKVQGYSEIEDRDIWEYHLNLDVEQTKQLVRHVWELGNTYFDYFYFKENCSYHILSLLEVGNPNWKFTDKFNLWALPADTIKVVVDQNGVKGSPVFRPARGTQIRTRLASHTQEEKLWITQIDQDIGHLKSNEFQQLSSDERATILDTVIEYSRYQMLNEPDSELKNKQQTLLVARSKLKLPKEQVTVEPQIDPPHQGHEGSRITFGVGQKGEQSFEELEYRASYHGILDDDVSYTAATQIELVKLRLRYLNQSQEFFVKSFDLIDIFSLFPMDDLFQKPSWKLRFGIESFEDDSCRFCTITKLNGGIGAATQTHLIRSEIFYALAELDLNYGQPFKEFQKSGLGGTLGVIALLTPKWKVHFFTSYFDYSVGEHTQELRASLHQRYTFEKNFSFKLEVNHISDSMNEILGALQYYF